MFVKRKKNINQFDLQECRDFTWRVSDCEELSGGYSQEMTERLKRDISFMCKILFIFFLNQ